MRQCRARTATRRGCGARRPQPLQACGACLGAVGLHDALPDACAFHCGGALERAGGARGAQASAKREALGTACGHARLSVAPAANATPATHARDTSAHSASPRSEQYSTWANALVKSRRAALERERRRTVDGRLDGSVDGHGCRCAGAEAAGVDEERGKRAEGWAHLTSQAGPTRNDCSALNALQGVDAALSRAAALRMLAVRVQPHRKAAQPLADVGARRCYRVAAWSSPSSRRLHRPTLRG